MGEAFDDLYDQMERMDTYCKKHKILYEELGFGCPDCEYEAEDIKGVDTQTNCCTYCSGTGLGRGTIDCHMCDGTGKALKREDDDV